jgi:ABC-type dipeptide/oligopeptide/nickel transport system permease component
MENKIGKIAWNVVYAIFYPIIMTFTLIFSGITYLFSLLSKLLYAIFSAFEKKQGSEASKK